MSTQRAILPAADARDFDAVPTLGEADRAALFDLPQAAKAHLNSLKKPVNQLVFIASYGYFRARGKFFEPVQFCLKDLQYIAQTYHLRGVLRNLSKPKMKTMLSSFGGATASRYRAKILELTGWRQPTSADWVTAQTHAKWQARKQSGQDTLFWSMLSFFDQNHWVIPSYGRLCELVAQSYGAVEDGLLSVLGEHINDSQANALMAMLNTDEDGNTPLTLAKSLEQSEKTRKIQGAAKQLTHAQTLYDEVKPVLDQLNLTEQATHYYAHWVLKARPAQVRQLSDRRLAHLHLMAFTKYQYFKRVDHAMALILKSIQRARNTAANKAQELQLKGRSESLAAIGAVHQSQSRLAQVAQDLLGIAEDSRLSDAQKLQRIRSQLMDILLETEAVAGKSKAVAQYLEDSEDTAMLYAMLAEQAKGLHQRIGGLVRRLRFDPDTDDAPLLSALQAYQAGRPLPLAFLSKKERGTVEVDGAVCPDRLFMVLMIRFWEGIRGGTINLEEGFNYLHINRYLIDKAIWQSDRSSLLEAAQLTPWADGENTLGNLSATLSKGYTDINQSIAEGSNGYLIARPDGRYRVKTPALERGPTGYIGQRLKEEGKVAVLKILRDMEHAHPFLHLLKHQSTQKNTESDPQVMFAGLIALGCNIGVPAMADMSIGINENTLKTAVDQRFSNENLRAINQYLVDTIQALPLTRLYRVENNRLFSGSDGKKVTVNVDSVLANYAYKYYGQKRGVAVYSFVDEAQRLFHSTVISAADREAAYVLDGLMNNTSDIQRIHVTDTHGFTHALFGTAFLAGIGFAPRIKRVEEQVLSSFSAKKTLQGQGYRFLPGRLVKRQHILDQWDTMLRLVATIKLGYSSGSKIFNRLNTYSRHHPLYRALTEFGRIIKTHHILQYYQNLDLRQSIQKQLNLVELSNKFHDAVFWARGKVFHVAEQGEQEQQTLCRSIIQNAILLWNYLTLSTQALGLDDPDLKAEMFEQIRAGSVLTWGHVNFTGEYDFSKGRRAFTRFPLKRIAKLAVPEAPVKPTTDLAMG